MRHETFLSLLWGDRDTCLGHPRGVEVWKLQSPRRKSLFNTSLGCTVLHEVDDHHDESVVCRPQWKNWLETDISSRTMVWNSALFKWDNFRNGKLLRFISSLPQRSQPASARCSKIACNVGAFCSSSSSETRHRWPVGGHMGWWDKGTFFEGCTKEKKRICMHTKR